MFSLEGDPAAGAEDVEVPELLDHDDPEQTVAPVQGSRGEDTGEVPEKQLFRWKDDGGAIHPDA
ncbi:MAG: hypothetical protein ABIO67_09545 [Mycobacteriales bacterium]